MRTRYVLATLGFVLGLVPASGIAIAQQVTVGTPFHTMHDSFFENNGISFAGRYRGINFSVGGAGLATPPFGGYDPSAGMRANFGFQGKDGFVNFATNFAQGNRQSLVSQTPSVTLTNGQTGYVSDTSQTPFVVSVIPVVGAFPVTPQQLHAISGIPATQVNPRVQAMLDARAQAQAGQGQPQPAPVPPAPAPPPRPAPPMKAMNVTEVLPPPPDAAEVAGQRLDAAQESTAGRPAPSVAEIRRMRQRELAAKNEEMAALMERARTLEEDGKPGVAKIYYQQVIKNGSGELKQQAQTRLYELNAK